MKLLLVPIFEVAYLIFNFAGGCCLYPSPLTCTKSHCAVNWHHGAATSSSECTAGMLMMAKLTSSKVDMECDGVTTCGALLTLHVSSPQHFVHTEVPDDVVIPSWHSDDVSFICIAHDKFTVQILLIANFSLTSAVHTITTGRHMTQTPLYIGCGDVIISSIYHIYDHCITTPCCVYKSIVVTWGLYIVDDVRFWVIFVIISATLNRHGKSRVIWSNVHCTMYTHNMAAASLNLDSRKWRHCYLRSV